MDSKLSRSEFDAAQRVLHVRGWRQYEWEYSRGVWSSVPLRSSSFYEFVGSRTEVWSADSVKASLGICKRWRIESQVFVARPRRVTRKEIDRSIREDLGGIRRLVGAGVAKELLAVLEEGDWEPESSCEDVEESEEKVRGDQGLRRNARDEVSLMALLQTSRRRHRK